ncbi:unnamed protein product [marine sediment metagenome]|uniref:Uncharacterized protein n=1 Tax=marine sediment metagenome TaxID=412755 RepID=X0VGS6_9ZZZZ
MATFPELSRSPGAKGFAEEIDPGVMQIGKKASGLPVLNKLFTFAGKTWKFTLYLTIQADKETVLTFYEANKDVPFDWSNTQETSPITYEVIFMHPPKCTLDKVKNRWRIVNTFTQYSPL